VIDMLTGGFGALRKWPWVLIVIFFGFALHRSQSKTLSVYLLHAYNANTGDDRERAAFQKVFNGKQFRFAGYAEKAYSCESYDHWVIPSCSHWLLLLALPGEFTEGFIEFDCKIKEFNVAYSLRYYENTIQR